MDNFMNKYDENFREGIDESVFRHRFVIHLTDIALMSQTKAALEAVDGIAKVNAHLEYAKPLSRSATSSASSHSC